MISKNDWSEKLKSLTEDISTKVLENSEYAKQRVVELLEHGLPPAQGDALVASLNGLVGDYLLQRNSRFALPLVFTDQTQHLSDDPLELERQLPDASGRIVLCVHGWCMADKGWGRKGHDHGQQLVNAGYMPIYLWYNTGNHISLNGEEFAFRLDKLLQAWPCEVKELVIIGHSMGGLVTRSACYYAEVNQLQWLSSLQTFITLGTPHNGAPLAKLACWIDDQVLATPQLKLLKKLGEIRSSGTKDLSQGFVVHQDWQEQASECSGDPDSQSIAALIHRPQLPGNVKCYAIASCLGKNVNDPSNRRLGDGLVPVSSALADSSKGRMALNYPMEHKWVVGGVNHLDLLNHPAVAAKISKWVLENTV
jgi:pimeloyl-ACP methyl ester carboxylesterase